MKPGQLIFCTLLTAMLIAAGVTVYHLAPGLSFGYPWVLFALPAPVLLLIWEVIRKGQPLVMPFDHGRQRDGAWLALWLCVPSVTPALLLGAAIVLLAQPRTMEAPRQHRVLTNIEFCLDVSGSMTASFGAGSRYDAAMAAIQRFTIYRKDSAFGLTIFGNEVLRWAPLTKDVSVIRNAAPFLRPQDLPGHFGGTEIGKALKFCRDTLIQQPEGDRMIILLSDGYSADLGGEISQKLAMDLSANNVVLYCIHVGDGQAPADLYALAGPTGGEVFAVDHPQALANVFEHIDRMQPAKFKYVGVLKVDQFRWPAMIGSILLAAYALMLLTGLRHTPW